MRSTLLFLFLIMSSAISAQALLSLEDAIRFGLENNYQVLIARNNEAIAKNNNTLGNAGFLPTVGANASLNRTINNAKQEFLSGQTQEGSGLANAATRAALTLNWTAFDGFRMFAAKDRLDLEQSRSRVFTQSEMHDLVTQIQNAYFGLVRLRQQISITEQSIQLNEAIKTLAEAKLQIGTGTSLDVLQTSTRLNADSSALLSLQDQLAQSKIGLNRLMGRDPGIVYQVSTEVPQIVLPTLEELNQLAIQQNFDIRLLNMDEQIALTQIKEVRSALYPTIDLNAAYNYNFSTSEAGFLLSNRTFGPTVTLTAAYDLYPGRNIKKDIANSEIFKENVQLNKRNLQEDLRSQMAILYQQYQALGNLLTLENRNLVTAQRNTALAEELYRSGRATSFEVREAILEETRVRDRLSDVQFRQKLSEIQLKSLAGIPLFNL